ncbi:MAG: hypothetical protein AB7R89_03480 [Dehalococcoidia bacterium]
MDLTTTDTSATVVPDHDTTNTNRPKIIGVAQELVIIPFTEEIVLAAQSVEESDRARATEALAGQLAALWGCADHPLYHAAAAELRRLKLLDDFEFGKVKSRRTQCRTVPSMRARREAAKAARRTARYQASQAAVGDHGERT